MDTRRIALVQGHPDPSGRHFCHALAEEYARGAQEGGHELHTLDISRLDFPLLRSAAEWRRAPPAVIRATQETIGWADHLAIIFPLWMGDTPALLKGFLEQLLRPGFALGDAARGRPPRKLLKGRSARLIVTMGMPALFYRVYYRAHSVRNLERNVLAACGIAPVRSSLIGMVESRADAHREIWLRKVRALGRAAA